MTDGTGEEVLPEPPGGPEDPWRSLRRQTDRRRYLRILTPRRTGKDRPRPPRPAVGVPRTHRLLGSPAGVTRTPSHVPGQQDVRDYLRHSADITMRGGNAAGLVYPLAACSLAEHYVFRRIAGSSSGAPAAAATAAAELGRGAPDPPAPDQERVVPGYAGLAQLVGWLAGGDPSAVDGPGPTDFLDLGAPQAEQHRLARLLQPTESTRGPYRVLLAALTSPGASSPRLAARLLLAGSSLLSRPTRALLLMAWLGLFLGWLGLTSALISGARAGAVSSWVTIGASMLLLLAFVLAGTAMSVLVELVSAAGRLRTAEPDRYGLIPGAAPAGPGGSRLSAWLDRRAGVPRTGAVPPLFSWLADRLDELAGGPDGHALTFGDLWSGSVGERSPAQQAVVRAAALDPEQRVIDLALTTTDLNGRRPHRLPFRPADEAERRGGSRFLFCEQCLDGLVPARVVTQMTEAAPSTDTDHPCPRHPDGVLRELPEPWDLPVVFAVRLSCSPPGLLAAVPLYSVSEVPAAAAHDLWGQQMAAPAAAGPSVARLHWFTDGGLTSNAAVSTFDTLLPRWPTFALTLEDAAPELAREIIRLPAQDAGAPHRSWRPIGGAAELFSALVDTGLSWRDSAQADLPGFRGRIALLRRTGTPAGGAWLLPQDAVLALAVRGLHAGAALRERFTGSDDQVPGQTQTDRYRWIRLRMALREYRNLSLGINARLPLYRDLASSYHVPAALGGWFDPPLPPAERDPAWADAASAITTLRALSAGGVLDFDADRGAPPNAPDLRLLPPE